MNGERSLMNKEPHKRLPGKETCIREEIHLTVLIETESSLSANHI